MKRIITGIQPTGNGSPHIGNYFGALRNIKNYEKDNELFVMVADVHATTVNFDPTVLRESTYLTVASLISMGINPKNVFKQSMVPEQMEMSTYLSHFATLGPMERMTQFKDKSAKSTNNDSIGFGLLSYPILMASDILCYNATHIPVGRDQHQHIQLTQNLAKKVNKKFGYEFFIIPKAIFEPKSEKIMDIQYPDKKMSKSSDNQNGVIYIMDELDIVSKKIKKAVTDSKPYITGSYEDQHDGVKNLITILSIFNNSSVENTIESLQGDRYSKLKDEIIGGFEKEIIPIQKNIKHLMANIDELQKLLILSSERSRKEANSVVELFKHNMGF